MAILLIRIENPASIPLNEFFDFAGYSYALTASRENQQGPAIRLEDFYEADAETKELKDIPVVFLIEKNEQLVACGWYSKARILAEPIEPSLFLSGNVIARNSDVVLLPERLRTEQVLMFARGRLYEVVEDEDERAEQLKLLLATEPANTYQRLVDQHVILDKKLTAAKSGCLAACERIAQHLMENTCRDLREIVLMREYADRAVRLDGKDADGYYYGAMACCQLGMTKQAIRLIEHAIRLEPEASDLLALKAQILVEMGYAKAAGELLVTAFDKSGEELYLLLAGRCLLLAGREENALELFRRMKDESLLRDAGIDPERLKKNDSLFSLKGFRFRNPFRRG